MQQACGMWFGSVFVVLDFSTLSILCYCLIAYINTSLEIRSVYISFMYVFSQNILH